MHNVVRALAAHSRRLVCRLLFLHMAMRARTSTNSANAQLRLSEFKAVRSLALPALMQAHKCEVAPPRR
jgi:hypothetical protein